MKSTLFTFRSFFYFLFCLSIASCGTEKKNSQAKAPQTQVQQKGQSAVQDDVSKKNILQIAIGSKDHTTLVAAVQAAGLEDVLSNAGPLTVFAPVNAAFDKLPEGTLETLLKPENKETLKTIITYHAAPGKYMQNNIKGVMGIGQATGDRVAVKEENGVITINGTRLLATVEASNGVVHVIDGVLLPPNQ